MLSRYGSLGASSRVRFYQYIPYLKLNGCSIDVKPLFSNEYIKTLYAQGASGKTIVLDYIRRVLTLLSVKKYDMVWLEGELFPYLPAFFEKILTIPYVVDYDDAIFHRYDQHSNPWIKKILGMKIDAVMKHSALVIAGNAYLAEWAVKSGAVRVEIIPTVVDVKQYTYSTDSHVEPWVVGWIGSPATTKYLVDLNDVFESVAESINIKVIAVGAKEEMLRYTSIEARDWSAESEVKSIQQFDIGVMPLRDSLWEKGKCGYKLIQYMACGIPVIASPIGVNTSIVDHGKNGFLASSLDDWKCYLVNLLKSESMRKEMGLQGLNKVNTCYSLQAQSPRIFRFLQEAATL